MSHHLDPLEDRQDPRLDISDLYLFRGDTGTVFVMKTNPLSGPGGFHPAARYEFKVDTDGDAVEDLTFRVVFGAAYPNGKQRIELRYLEGPAAGDRDAEGRVVAQGMTGEECQGAGGMRLWAFVAGDVIGAVSTAVSRGAPIALPDTARTTDAGTNACGIVLEVPGSVLGTQRIGFWGTTALLTEFDGWRQVSRYARADTIPRPVDAHPR